MFSTTNLSQKDLRACDIIFLYKKERHFHMHIGVVSRKKENEYFYLLHATIDHVQYSPP